VTNINDNLIVLELT